MSIDIKSILKQAQRPSTVVEVCLRGDLAAEYEQLERALAKLPPNNKLGGDPERRRITGEMERLRAEMREGTVPFRVQALSDADFQALLEDHPPRREGDEVNDRDAYAGYNRLTFTRALIRACVVEPELDDAEWDLLFSTALTPGQVLKLGAEASRVNGQDVDVPFSPDDSSGSTS